VPGGSRASLRSAWDGEDVAGACDAGVDGGGDVCDSAGVAAKATATNNARGGLRIFMVIPLYGRSAWFGWFAVLIVAQSEGCMEFGIFEKE